ncbi:MAG: hypothetical protein CMG75_01055 [Candidatus Marinimicrobia bacterium]|nr:hypothetical protein [Candidatus Neomarinimicrobiota bacterium]|tara:strand:+ start:2012 stop:2326 length:315 start_codon:yes stop_codon:yes gene_type:complete
MGNLVIDKYEIVNEFLIIKWEGGNESYLPLVKLRDACPCAECSGETDAFGNIYKSQTIPKTDGAYVIIKVKTVGYYAIQIFWSDGHNSGIYRFELLEELGNLDN